MVTGDLTEKTQSFDQFQVELNRLEMLERIKEGLPVLALEYKAECTPVESLICRQLGDEQ